ncbi:hypothetical protein [Spiribacter insolitus]|uniref:Uncharacterized protein n=1 Tax=Spiribacter insolitus TaxID=3122417 RepID=A0ABV3T473_9GAMM
MDRTPYRLDLNWQTRLALDWLTHDPETAAYWRAIASANDISAVAHELTTAMVEEVSALPVSWARDAATKSLQQVEWRELAQALGAE